MHPNFVHPRAEIPGTDVVDMVTRFRETIMTAFGLAGAAVSELSLLGARPAGAGRPAALAAGQPERAERALDLGGFDPALAVRRMQAALATGAGANSTALAALTGRPQHPAA